jgi:O-antigen/teichoic acid export membrane protein
MSVIKKLAGQTALYGLSSIVGRFLNYLLVPLYTGIFTPADYGVSSIFYAFASFGAVIFTYGMETAFFRFYQKSEEKERVFSTTLWSILISSLILGLLIILFRAPLARWTENAGYDHFFIHFAIILAADAITTIPFAWLRQQNEAMRFALLRLLSIGVNIGLNLFFYWLVPILVSRGLFAPLDTEGGGIVWMFVANVASSLVVLPFFLNEFKLLKYGFDKTLWREMLIYAYPLIFMGFAGMINETLDRQLLNWLISDPSVAKHEVGVYSANYKLSIIITLFIQAFRFAAEPFFFSRAKEADAKVTYARVMNYFMLVCATIFLMVMLYLDIFKFFIRKSAYWEGLHVVPILLMANVFLGAYYNLSIWYKLTDKTQLGARVSIIGALITLILNYLWIPILGYTGSAWATFVCYFSMSAISFYLGQKHYPVPYNTRRIAAYLALSFGMYLIYEMVKEMLGISPSLQFSASLLSLNTLLATALFAIYLFIIFKLENKQLKGLLKKAM